MDGRQRAGPYVGRGGRTDVRAAAPRARRRRPRSRSPPATDPSMPSGRRQRGRCRRLRWPAVTVLGRSPSVTSTVLTLPLRTSVTLTRSPDVRSATAACRSLSLRMSLPATLVMMSPPSWIGWLSSVALRSPARMPAFVGGAAGRDLLHECAVGDGHDVLERLVDGQRVDPQVAAVDAAGLLEVGDDLLGGVDRHREADADAAVAAAAAGGDLRVDADDLAGRVDERAAGVAGVDRRVGLQHVVDLEAVGRLDRALDRGDRRRW